MNKENVENREKVAEVIDVMNRNVNTITERNDQPMPTNRIVHEIHVTHSLSWWKILRARLIVFAILFPIIIIIGKFQTFLKFMSRLSIPSKDNQ